MAHDIDNTTGKPAIAYVGETPWHGLGEKLPEGEPIETWVKAARLDWTLERLPVQYFFKGMSRTMEDRFVLVRSDVGAPLSIVSDDYRIVQPKEVLEFYRDLVKSSGYSLETAGSLDGGRKVWALAKTKITATLPTRDARRDELAAYVLLATSCDKTLATTAALTSIRVVCQNTLAFARRDIAGNNRPQVKVPHNASFDAVSVKIELGLVQEAWDPFIEKVEKMAMYSMKPDKASSFFKDLLRQKDDKPLSARAFREHQTLMALYKSAPGQELSTAEETLWGVVNAVTYYADHARKNSTGDRLDSAWFGSGRVLKEKAWAAASACLN